MNPETAWEALITHVGGWGSGGARPGRFQPGGCCAPATPRGLGRGPVCVLGRTWQHSCPDLSPRYGVRGTCSPPRFWVLLEPGPHHCLCSSEPMSPRRSKPQIKMKNKHKHKKNPAQTERLALSFLFPLCKLCFQRMYYSSGEKIKVFNVYTWSGKFKNFKFLSFKSIN